MQKIAQLAIFWSAVDVSLIEGYRTPERQQALFKRGLTKIDGIHKKGKHNYKPSLALDFCAYIPGMRARAYDKTHLAYIAGIFSAAAAYLLNKGEISHRLRWGANWDQDGVLVFDQNFLDMPHVELVPI